ncbi:MAG: aromatic amino acid transport family protein [Minisyncoccia bacterium]
MPSLEIKSQRKSYVFAKLEAIAALVGTIIGAGVFTLPKIAEESGLLPTLLWLGIVLILIIYLHLAYGEIVLRTPKEFRLPGYAGYYLGEPSRKLMLLTTFFTFSFSLLIYLFLGGQFLSTFLTLFLPSHILPSGFLVIFLWLLLSLAIFSKQDHASRINLILSFLLLILFVVIAFFAFSRFQSANLDLFNFSYKWSWLIPYGVLFYALNGMVAVPEAISVIKRKRVNQSEVKGIIITGILISAFCYLLFIISVLGATGSSTTLEAIGGLKILLGNGIVIIGAILGLLAVITSYLIFAIYIKNSFIHDFHWSPFISNFVVVLGPLVLYFAHMMNIVKLISFMGGMLGGFEGSIVLFTLYRAKKKSDLAPSYEVPLNHLLLVFFFFALLAGALCQIFLIY